MISRYFRPARMAWLIAAVVLPLLVQNESLAAFGEDTEKPVPEFTRMGTTITAKLTPRAKSTSILIDFKTAQGRLTDVKGIEYETLRTPDLDIKEFKSSFFEVTVDSLSPGSDAEIIISSSFFAVSTEYWLYNSKKPAWFDSGIKAIKGNDNSNQFVIRVTDGGELDSDGVANGRIQFIGGPKDYFWSYALGTLVVRFFGVFLVLSMLMIGMLVAGQFFITLEKRRSRLTPPLPQAPKPAPAPLTEPINSVDVPSAPDTDTVAAIATAFHLHLAPGKSHDADVSNRSDRDSWVQYGRVDIQNTRFQTFLRPINPRKHH
jgi:hypothetical protein